ncbi:MAG: TolC family protein [Synergistaceae bacterium]|nr:TolC family protein [Synergistaceae bacterium]
MKKIIICLLIVFYCSSSFALESSDKVSGLSLVACLKIAIENHPSLKKSKGAVRASSAQLEQTKTANRWKVTLTGRTNYNGTYDYWDDRYHDGSLGVNATKTLYDTGINRLNREIGAEDVRSAIESERGTQITVAAAAKKAYYDLVLKILNRDVEREKLSNLEEHLKTARGIYEVGNSSLVEVTKAEADFASARVSLLKAENDILVSQEALKVAMGVTDYDTFNLVIFTDMFLPQPAGEIEQLISIAMADRSDYRRIISAIRRRELEIKAAARDSSPTITGSIGSDLSKREGTPSTNNYNFNINVNIPLVDGGMTKAKIDSARAMLEQEEAEEESLRQTIARDLRTAALSLMNAIDRVKSSEISVKYAEDNLALARGRYEVGVGSPLEVSDAVSTLATSRYALYQALYDAQAARTELDEAMGHLPPELNIEGNM